MKIYSTTTELKEAAPFMPALHAVVQAVEDMGEPESRPPDITMTSLGFWLGGDVHVCETEEDLRQIKGVEATWSSKHEGAAPDVTDIPMVWDVCGYCSENGATSDFKHGSEWFLFVLCNNNAGGPSYYVPKSLWKAARVEEHLAAHNLAWGQ